MRAIKFRGKMDGRWWYFVANDSNEGEWSQFWALVQRKTVGEWTSLLDKHGNEIYEGDILRLGPARERYVPVASPDTQLEIYYTHGAFSTKEGGLGDVTNWHECEIIGNIHDTPDLLERR